MYRISLIWTMVQAITVLTVLKMMAKAQTCGQGGTGRLMYERIPNYQLQGFDDEVVRDTQSPLKVLEKCQEFCLRDRSSTNANMARACSSFDFQPGSRISSMSGNGNGVEYEESTCYLTQEQAEPEGIGHLMYVPNSVHFSEICIISNRPDRECPRSQYVFERHPRKKLDMVQDNLKEMKATNRSDCANQCLNEFSFVCRSASFDASKGMCLISRFTRRTHPELLKDDINSEYLENTCLNYERRCDGFFAFIMEKNRKFGGPFEVDLIKNTTLEECKEKCIHADTYFCRSIEYDTMTQECSISEEDSVSQKDELISKLVNNLQLDPILMHLLNKRKILKYRRMKLTAKFGYEYPENSVTSHLFSNRRLPDTAFQRYRNSRLGTEFHSEITGKTLSECLDECLRHTSFQCHSVVYSDRFRTCRLSRHDQKSGMRIIYDADYDYYENLMLNTETDENGDNSKSNPSRLDQNINSSKKPTYNRRPTFEDDRKIPARYPIDPYKDDRGPPGSNTKAYHDRDPPVHDSTSSSKENRKPDFYNSNRRPTERHPLSQSSSNFDDRNPYNWRPPSAGYNDDDDDDGRFNDGRNRRPYNRYPGGYNGADPHLKYYDADPYYLHRDRLPGRYPDNGSPYNRYNERYPPYPRNNNFDDFYNFERFPSRDSGHFSAGYNGYFEGRNRDNFYYNENRNKIPQQPNFKHFTDYDSQELPLRERYPTFQDDREINPLFYDLNKPNYGRGQFNMYANSENRNKEYLSSRNKHVSEEVRFLGNNRWVSSAHNDYYDDYGKPNVIGPSSSRCNTRDGFKLMATNKKIRKSFVRRYGNANTLPSCQQECTEARDFQCRSFNYRAQSPPYDNGLENCELSDQSFKDPNYNSLDFFENSSGMNYYERVNDVHEDANEECLDVSQTCDENGMEFILRTNEPFYGRLYSYGFYDRCFFNANGGTKNVLKISGPGVYPECGTQRHGDIMTNIVVVQYNDNVQTGKDKRYNLTCLLTGPGEAVVRSGYIGAASSGPSPIEYLQARNSLSSKVKMKIYYNGRETTTIAVGDPLTLRIYADSGDEDIFTSNVVARDPHSGRSVTLIDKGCAINRKVFPEMSKQRDNDGLEASFYGFKLPESNFLIFEATVYTCKTACQPVYCPNTPLERTYRLRRKRDSTRNYTETNNYFRDDPKEKISELVTVYKSRQDIQQDATQLDKYLSEPLSPNSSACFTNFEYNTLLFGVVIFIFIISIFSVLIGIAYRNNSRKNKLKSKSKKSVDSHSNDPKSTISTIFGSIQKPFNYDANNLFEDPSEPIYTDASLFERVSDFQGQRPKCSYP